MKRIIALLLVLSTAVCLCACVEKDAAEVQQEQNKVVTEYGLDPDKEYKDYDGYDFRILTVGSTGGSHWSAFEFHYDETLTGDALNEAVLERDSAVSSLFNINISYVEKESGQITDFVRQSVLSGSDEFDLVTHNLNATANMARDSLLINLRDYDDVLNLEAEYWDQNAINSLDLEGHLYFTPSDLTLIDKQATWVIFFTKAMFDKYPNLLPEGYTDIYDMVNKGDWTIEHMYNMVKSVSQDDGDGQWTNLDVYGHFGEGFSVNSLMIGCGASCIEKNGAGEYEYVLDRNVDDLVRCYGLVDEIVRGECSMMAGRMSQYVNDIWVDGAGSLMEKNRVLFNLTGMNRCRLFRNLEADFGIIPMPKATAEQDSYYMHMTSFANCVSVPISATDKVRTCDILENLTAIANQTTYRAYIEQSLKGKYLRDDESAEMLDIIFDSRRYDIGDIFGGFGASQTMGSITSPDAVASFIKKQERRCTGAIKKLLENMQDVYKDTARK